jgi:predicted double-glycine peptidase
MRDLKSMEVLTQKGPSCGTTSLAMVIRFLTGNKTLMPVDIDRKIRKLPSMFSSPVDLIAYAREKGLRAGEYNNSSLQELDGLISRGIPAIALLDLTPGNALDFDKWHWVVVVAIEGANDNKIITVNNPWGRQEEWKQDKFLGEWAHLRLLGLSFGYNNYFIAIGTADDNLPKSHAGGAGAANIVVKGLADILNGFAAVRSDKDIGGIGKMLIGICRLVYGIPLILVYNLYRLVKQN